MSNEQSDQDFRARADALIHLANEQRREAKNDSVNASFLYAATRFSAFIVASASQDAAEMQQDRDEALDFFTERFRAMLSENLDDYATNYEDDVQRFRNA